MVLVDSQFEVHPREALSNAPTQPLKAAVLSAPSASVNSANDSDSCWLFPQLGADVAALLWRWFGGWHLLGLVTVPVSPNTLNCVVRSSRRDEHSRGHEKCVRPVVSRNQFVRRERVNALWMLDC